MENVKHWILNRCKQAGGQISSLNLLGSEQCKVFSNVVTPNSIPQFTIPGTCDSSPSDEGENRLEELSLPCSNTSSPRLSAGDISNHSPLLTIPSPLQSVRSAPVSPSRPPEIRLHQEAHSLGSLESDTNADPLSMAAVSLPHFRTTTRFGFQTVSENPHVRRKESLFHDGPAAASPLLPKKSRTKRGSGERNVSPSSISRSSLTNCDSDLEEEGITRGRRSLSKKRPTVIAPLGVYIGSDSPAGSPGPSSPGEESDIIKHPLCRFLSDNPLTMESKTSSYYYRRRSSVSIGSDTTSGGDSSYADDLSITNESSPNFRMCPNGTIEPIHVQPVKRHSNPSPRPKPPTFASGEIPKSQSLNSGLASLKRVKRGSSDKELEENRESALRGEIKLAIQYLEEEKELIVTALKAENLGGCIRPENTVNPFLKLCLLPGKMQKQQSRVYKHNKNPQFNKDFSFKDVNLDELQRMRLRVRVCSKGHNIMSDDFLGEVHVALSDLDLIEEMRVWKKLESKSEQDDKGFLEVAICFEPKHERLKIGILQAKGLPRHSITGQPDPYVKIRVCQPGRQEIKRQTRIKKKTSQPEFNENFTFIISPRVEDLNYTTVTLAMLSHETIRTDDVIGNVRFGFRSTEETETSHWQQVLVFPGKEYVRCHTLVT